MRYEGWQINRGRLPLSAAGNQWIRRETWKFMRSRADFMVKSWVPLLPRGSIATTLARACEAVPYWGQLLCRTSASMKGEPGRAALSTTPTTGKRIRIPPKTAACQYFDGVGLRWDTTIWPHGDVVPGTVTHSPAPWHIRLSYRPTRAQVSPRGLEAAVKESNSLPPCPKIILRLASAQS